MIGAMDLLHRTDTPAISALYTAIVIAIGASGYLVWRTVLGHDDGILRLLRHFF